MKTEWLYFKEKSRLSLMLVIIQFFCLGYLILSARPYPNQPGFFVPYIIGIFVGSWAIAVMRKEKINISPDPHPGIRVVTDGPYKWIRHPMYFAIVLTMTPLLLNYFSAVRLIIYAVLFINLIIKLEYEERLLLGQIPGYNNYRKRTWKLVPLLY